MSNVDTMELIDIYKNIFSYRIDLQQIINYLTLRS